MHANLVALDPEKLEAGRVEPGLQGRDKPGQAQAGKVLETLDLMRGQRRRPLDHVLVEHVGEDIDQRLALEAVEGLAQRGGDLPQVRTLGHGSSLS